MLLSTQMTSVSDRKRLLKALDAESRVWLAIQRASRDLSWVELDVPELAGGTEERFGKVRHE